MAVTDESMLFGATAVKDSIFEKILHFMKFKLCMPIKCKSQNALYKGIQQHIC
jgi:hypothetical protein